MSQNLVAKINPKHCALYSAMVLELNMFNQLSSFSTNNTNSSTQRTTKSIFFYRQNLSFLTKFNAGK